MIKVKTFFSGWKEISEEQALKWAVCVYNGILTDIDKIEFINSRLQGVQFTESEIKQATRK